MKKRRILSALLAAVTAAGTAIGAAGAVTAADKSPYKDVKKSRWSYNEIMYASENGYMNGKGGGLFSPEETMTRAMVVTVLYRFQGEPEVKYKATFTDVKAKDWYADAVIWAADNGIVNGISDGVFAPMENITRQQLAAILIRYAPLEYIKTEKRKDITGYKDYKKVQSYARDAMSWANAEGLITGVTKTTLEPRSGATREQFAVILKRFKENDTFEYRLVYNKPTYSTDLDRSVELVTDADIYVAVDGNDANAGTLDKPIATFARAKEMVRELKKTATDEIVVAFKAGNYGALENITFTSEDGGTADVPIRYTAYGDGEVIFANGMIIDEDEFVPISADEREMFPEKARDNIMKVDLTGRLDEMLSNNVLFSESSVCHEARYPNKDSDGTDRCFKNFTTRYEEPGKDEFEYDSIILQSLAAKTVDGFSTVEGMKVTGFLRTGWFIDTFKVKAYDKSTKILTFDFSNRYDTTTGYSLDEYCLAFEGRMDDTVFFHNLAELLDSKNEYWFDSKTHILYVYDPSGDYTIAEGGKFMTVERGAEYLSFVGLSFNGSTDVVITNSADHITVDKCRFNNIGSQSRVIGSTAKYFTLTNCELGNFVNGGAHIYSSGNVRLLEECHNVIENNYFHDFGQPQFFVDACALNIGSSVGALISHNVFKSGSHAAIQFSGVDCIIEYNVFDNMMRDTDDFGAVYTYNSVGYRDNEIRYNLFVDIPIYGVYLDDNTCGQKVYGNIFCNAGCFVLHGGRDNEVHDNVYIDTDFSYKGPCFDTEDEDFFSTAFYTYLISQRADESNPTYETWRKRWPLMYNYSYDIADIGKYECVYTTVHHIKNNGFIDKKGKDVDFGETAELYGDIENNVSYKNDVNPFFTDPTHGDYTIKSGAGVLSDEYIPQMGIFGIR